jgi:hypothetical protein
MATMAARSRTPAPQTPDADAPRARFVAGRYAWETLGPGPAPAAVLYSVPLDRGRDWTADELRQLKRDWFREAQGNDELRYLRDLTRGLGSQVRTRDGAARVWEGRAGGLAGLGGQRVRVVADRSPDGKERLRVTVGEHTVCDTARGLFVPGRWLDATRGALPELERAHAQREQAQAEALRRELGLDRRPARAAEAEARSLAWTW